jgi:5'-3' exonuclease
MSELLLIDLSSLAHMQWHVSASEPDPNWTSIKVVERVRGLASGHPHVAVCIDTGRSFRKDIDPTYKATRPEHLATLQHQIDLAIDTLRADGFPIFGAKGYEADDIIATCVDHALTSPLSPVDATVKIVSSDKDLTQLVSERVSVQSATNGHVYDVTGVIEKFGVKPEQIRDYLALVGDVSDNIVGAKGIGAKRAAQLLQQFDSLAGIFDAKLLPQITSGVTPAIVTALREFQPRAETVKALLTLKTDAPIHFEDIWRERVAADAHLFGTEDDPMMNDIEEAMPTLVEGPQVPLPEDDTPLGDMSSVRPSAANGGDSPKSSTPAEHGEAGRAPTGGTIGVLPSRGDSGGPTLEVLAAPVEFERQLEPRNIAQAKQLATDLFASRLFSAYGHPAGVLATILAGRELGLQTTASLRAIHIIDGKQALAADLIRALVLKSGKAEYFVCSERTSDKATFETKRKSDPKPITLTYTLQEGRQAWQKDDRAWTASGWGRNPADMCVARAGAKLARLVYPDVVHGLYAPEEIES